MILKCNTSYFSAYIIKRFISSLQALHNSGGITKRIKSVLLYKIGGCYDDSAFSIRIRFNASAHVHHAASCNATVHPRRRTCELDPEYAYVRIRGILST